MTYYKLIYNIIGCIYQKGKMNINQYSKYYSQDSLFNKIKFSKVESLVVYGNYMTSIITHQELLAFI